LRAGLVHGPAVVERLQPVERIEIGLEGVRKAIDQPGAGADVHAAPRLALEGGARAFHRAVDVPFGRVRNLCDHVAGRGIADVEHLAVTGLDLAAVDEITVDLDVDGFGGNVHASLISITMALRLSAGSTRFSVAPICALMMRAAERRSRFCIASI